MIEPIRIQLRSLERGEAIEIASGAFLGHQCGVMSCAVDGRAETIPDTYAVNGQHYKGIAAALNACMSAAYAYVAAETSAEA